MDTASIILIPSLLFLAAVVLMVSHFRAWRRCQKEPLGEEDLDFHRRQFRRRMQTSAMLAVLAVAMLVGYVLTQWLNSGWFALVYWTAVMIVACWLALLAAVDIWATNHYFGRLRHQCVVEQAKLQMELRRIQSVRGNGHSKSKNPIPYSDETHAGDN